LERRVTDLMRLMRPDEKLALLARVRAGISIQGNDRLGIPAVRVVLGAMGISARDPSGHPVIATAFPANIGMAATWNPELSEQAGGVIAQQARALGRGEVLGPLTAIGRSALSGRVFETYGEDPWLASRLVNGYVSGVQAGGEIATAISDGGAADRRSAREYELRPLESAVTEAGVWAVMRRDGTQSAGFEFLKRELGFRGFTVGFNNPRDDSAAEAIDEQVRGILRAMFSSGVFDRPVQVAGSLETPPHRALARLAAEQSIVLLKNEGGLLPLDPKKAGNKLRSIAVIGPNAATNRMASGSYTVAARYGATPLDALRNSLGAGAVTYVTSPAETARADAAIVFVGTGAGTEGEGLDRASLSLPAGQDELIQAVANANPRTIVVLIAGSPIAMDKWIGKVPAVLDAWFPGEEGGSAIANVLSGAVNPSGRLPIGFPAYPFGFGLSYTRFEYTDLAVMPQQVTPGQFAEVSLNVRNTGGRAGRETVQLYLNAIHSASSVARAGQELRAFQQVELQPGETKRVHFTLTGNATAYFDEQRREWVQDQAVFEVRVGSSAADIRVTGKFETTE
jgi:beta-glucosidase